MSKKEQNKEPKTQTVEQPNEQPTEQPTEQPKEQPTEQPTKQPTEQPKEQPTEQSKKSNKPAGTSGDAVVAKQLMAKLGVDKIYKAGSYWFKSRDDAGSWAKQQRCEVEEYGGAEK